MYSKLAVDTLHKKKKKKKNCAQVHTFASIALNYHNAGTADMKKHDNHAARRKLQFDLDVERDISASRKWSFRTRVLYTNVSRILPDMDR